MMSGEQISNAIQNPEASIAVTQTLMEKQSVLTEQPNLNNSIETSLRNSSGEDARKDSNMECENTKTGSDEEIVFDVTDISEDDNTVSHGTGAECVVTTSKECTENIHMKLRSDKFDEAQTKLDQKKGDSLSGGVEEQVKEEGELTETISEGEEVKIKNSNLEIQYSIPEAAQLLEMELRQRALEAELRRNANQKWLDSKQSIQADTEPREKEMTEDYKVGELVEKDATEMVKGDCRELNENSEQNLQEDTISVHPQCEESEDEFLVSDTRRGGGVGKFLEDRLRKRALQALKARDKESIS